MAPILGVQGAPVPGAVVGADAGLLRHLPDLHRRNRHGATVTWLGALRRHGDV